MYATFPCSFRTRGNDSGKSAEEERDEWCKVSANWGGRTDLKIGNPFETDKTGLKLFSPF